jgi:alginate O-acetyltransferase complex protein AlgI
MFEPIVHSAGVNVFDGDYLKYGKLYGIFIVAAILFALPWPERFIRKYSGKWQSILILFIFFWLSIYFMAINANNPFMYFKF